MPNRYRMREVARAITAPSRSVREARARELVNDDADEFGPEDIDEVAPKRPIDDVSFGVQVAAWWSLCFLIIALGLVVLIWLLNEISLVTITMTLAIMICALLQPIVGLLRRFGVPKPIAVLVVFVGGIGVISFLTWFVISQIAYNKDSLLTQLGSAADGIRHWLITGPLKMKATEADKYTTNLAATLNEHGVGIDSAVQTASSAVGVLSGGVLCLFATLFLLLDNGSMWKWVVRLFPRHTRPHMIEAGIAAWSTLTAYMRSLVLLAALNALAMVPFMMWAGLPLVIPLAVLLFLGSLIPMVGVLVAGAVMCLIAFVTKGVTTAIVMAIVLTVVIQLFGNLLNPIILGKAVSIHPLVILAGVTGGTLLAGMFGAFVGVPLIAVINNAVHAMRRHHRVRAINLNKRPPGASASAGAEHVE